MRRFCHLTLLLLLLAFAVPVRAETRALLTACSDFISQPDLGSAISGNLHMIGSALLGASPSLSGLAIKDGTIGTQEALESAVKDAFSQADEDDLSILYLCTHGVLSSSDDEQVYLLLGNGENESPLSSAALRDMLSPISGDKLLIIDACFSGALIGRSIPEDYLLPGTRISGQTPASPFLGDTSIHVLTSASGNESSWYYDAEGLKSGAVSYFASALSSGLGLYGTAEADLNGDGAVSLNEMHRHLSAAVPSSSCQLLSARADDVFLPTAKGTLLSRPLSGFSYGESLLTADHPVFDFSFTVTKETLVQYRLIEHENGSWNWNEAQTFLDGSQPLTPGRHSRSLTLPTIKAEDSGYLMLQVFSVSQDELILCSERLIAVQPRIESPSLHLSAPDAFAGAGVKELPISVTLGVPAEFTVTVYDANGRLLRRLASGIMTRPGTKDTLSVFWDGRDAEGRVVPDGQYMLRAETFAGLKRIKTSLAIQVSSGILTPAPAP